MQSQWPHFTIEELSCPCCGVMGMDSVFMAKMELLRILVGFPLPVSSGYRCPVHNEAIGGGKPHPTGKALDIVISGHKMVVIVQFALNQGFMGIGIRQHGEWPKRIVHLDMTDRPHQTIWTY